MDRLLAGVLVEKKKNKKLLLTNNSRLTKPPSGVLKSLSGSPSNTPHKPQVAFQYSRGISILALRLPSHVIIKPNEVLSCCGYKYQKKGISLVKQKMTNTFHKQFKHTIILDVHIFKYIVIHTYKCKQIQHGVLQLERYIGHRRYCTTLIKLEF